MLPNRLKNKSKPPTFTIRRPPFNTTLVRQIARQHLTHFNNVFWVSEHSFRLVRQSFSKISMPTPGPGIHGVFEDAVTWKGAVDEFRVWARQHVLISAASLLEVYIQSAATAALASTPELVDRSLAGTHGLVFIKYPKREPKYLKKLIASSVDEMTSGSWKDRFAATSRVFGTLPTELTNLTKALQSIQDRRNRIAHSYGVGGELRKTPWEPIEAIAVAPSHIISAITDVSSAIKLADDKVFSPQIGAYEILHEYHVWLRSNRNATHQMVSGTLQSEFRNHIGKAFGATPGADYIKEMIAYYDALL
jgi:hypothetical protein